MRISTTNKWYSRVRAFSCQRVRPAREHCVIRRARLHQRHDHDRARDVGDWKPRGDRLLASDTCWKLLCPYAVRSGVSTSDLAPSTASHRSMVGEHSRAIAEQATVAHAHS